MNHSRITIRYAKALLQLAVEQNILEQSYSDMVLLDSVFKANKELSLLLKSPIVKTDQKLSIFKEIFESKIGEVSMAFINIITTKKRENLLALIASSFISCTKRIIKLKALRSLPQLLWMKRYGLR
jgi:F-type H+-transporting ATPase subunit delta